MMLVMSDDAGQQYLVVRQLYTFPNAPFMLVPRVRIQPQCIRDREQEFFIALCGSQPHG